MDKFETKKNNTAADNSAAEEKTAIKKAEETQLIAEPLEALGVTISVERYFGQVRPQYPTLVCKFAVGFLLVYFLADILVIVIRFNQVQP